MRLPQHRFSAIFWRFRLINNDRDAVSMQIMILGASRSSVFLMKRLIEKGHTCVLVDPKAQAIEQQFKLGILTIDGIIIDIDILTEADIGSMDIVCAMSDSENQNIMASQIARDISM